MFTMPEETQPEQKPGFQRRYGLDVQDRAIRLRRSGLSWKQTAREVGVSATQVKRWVYAKEREEGQRSHSIREVGAIRSGFLIGYFPNEDFPNLCLFYEAKMQQIAKVLENGILEADPKNRVAIAKATADVYFQAFRIMRNRTQKAGSEEDDLGKYQEHLAGQLEKANRKLNAIKQAQTDAIAAEPIELTAEKVEVTDGN